MIDKDKELTEGDMVVETMVAIDPGKTSGYCIGTYVDKQLFLTPGQEQFTLVGMSNFVGYLPMRCQIIYEDFEYRAFSRAGLDLTPVKMIGIIERERELREGLHKEENQTYFWKQKAAEGKAFWSNDKLKEAELYVKGKPHGMDAMRHLLQFVHFKYGTQIVPPKTPMVLDVNRLHLEAYYGGKWGDSRNTFKIT